MPLSLHAALIPGWLQILGSVRHLVDKAETHCNAHGLPAAELLDARLIDDMWPLSAQFVNCCTHTLGAIEAVRNGVATIDTSSAPSTFAGIAARIDHALTGLAAVDPAELEQFIGKDVAFSIPDVVHLPFTAERFLLGFSQPNFYFHATTAYAILRMKGVSVGKADYIGALPLKS